MSSDHRSAYLSGASFSGQPASARLAGAQGSHRLFVATTIYLALLHLDWSPSATDNSYVGWRNVVIVGVLPTLLALGARALPAMPPRSVPAMAATALIAYALLAALWSPYVLAGLEQGGYLWSYGCLFLVCQQIRRHSESSMTIAAAWLLIAGIVISLLRMTVVDEASAVGHRFTSFVAPQAFSLALSISFGMTLYGLCRRWISPIAAVALGAIGIVAALANGGRQGFVAIVLLCGIGSLWRRGGKWLAGAPAAMIATAAVLSIVLQAAGPGPLRTMLAEHRPLALLLITPASLQETGDAGTFRDRLLIYKALLKRIGTSAPRELMFGHGTSASALVIAEGEVRYRDYDASTVDPNRTAHNEWLRALHEWGVVGLLLLAVVLLWPVQCAWKLFRTTGRQAALVLLALSLAAFAGYPLLGNILAATSGPLGAALVLLYAEIDARHREHLA